MAQSALAEALDLSQQAASRRLTGKVEFSLSELEKVAEVLGVPVEYLMQSQAPEAASA